MKTWITLCLSLVLCSVHVLGALAAPVAAPSDARASCCKPSRGTHCPTACCVDRDAATPSEGSATGLPAQPSRVSVDTPALLTLAWLLSAPRPVLRPQAAELEAAAVGAAMPLFLRHGVLLI